MSRDVKIFYRLLTTNSGNWVLSNLERHLIKYHSEETKIPMKIKKNRDQKSVESHEAEAKSSGDEINSNVTTNKMSRKMIPTMKNRRTNKNSMQTIELQISPIATCETFDVDY